MGCRLKLTDPATLRAIDRWYAQPGRVKSPRAKIMAHRYGVSIQTLHDAVMRKRAYAGLPRTPPLLLEAVMRYRAGARSELLSAPEPGS